MAAPVTKRKAGEPLNIPAKEWNAIADVVNFGVSQNRVAGFLPQSITVLVRNDAGEDLDRFDCASLAEPLFTLESNGSVDLIFSLVKADPAKQAAILTEPIAHDATNKRFGRVWIHGLAYAFVGPGATSLTYGLPTPTNNRLTPGGGDIRLLAAPSATVEKLLPVLLQGSQRPNIIFQTRSGGIAARSTSSPPHTYPSATVDLLDPVNLYSPTRTEVVSNMTSITIDHVAGRPRQGKWIVDRYFIDVDDCN
jgi:hypothetical protein